MVVNRVRDQFQGTCKCVCLWYIQCGQPRFGYFAYPNFIQYLLEVSDTLVFIKKTKQNKIKFFITSVSSILMFSKSYKNSDRSKSDVIKKNYCTIYLEINQSRIKKRKKIYYDKEWCNTLLWWTAFVLGSSIYEDEY